jgi:hypothetical protein
MGDAVDRYDFGDIAATLATHVDASDADLAVEILTPENGRAGNEAGPKPDFSLAKKRTVGAWIYVAVARTFTRIFADSPFYRGSTLFFF